MFDSFEYELTKTTTTKTNGKLRNKTKGRTQNEYLTFIDDINSYNKKSNSLMLLKYNNTRMEYEEDEEDDDNDDDQDDDYNQGEDNPSQSKYSQDYEEFTKVDSPIK